MKHDIPTAKKLCETAISLAHSTGNTRRHSHGLNTFAWIKFHLGDYSAAQSHAYESQRLARISADNYGEASALSIEAICYGTIGNYKQSISLSNRARDLLGLCGMSGGTLEHHLMNTQAEIHNLKSEYVDARNIYSKTLQQTSGEKASYIYSAALRNVAEIDVSTGAPKEDVQKNCDTARELFRGAGYVREVTTCDMILADLYLREQNLQAAKTLFEQCPKLSLRNSQIMTYCLERLGDASRWGTHDLGSSWTTVFLVHSLRQKEKLGIHKALQFLGDMFLAQDDEHTAISLFTVALEGFTCMDVHRSRAECMLRLGDISKRHGDLLKAVELWETARPLFERSSQAKQIQHIDQRLACVNEDMLGQNYGVNDLKDMEELNLDDENKIDLVAV
jgi:tetratricopeptide (TPR) repeat protein